MMQLQQREVTFTLLTAVDAKSPSSGCAVYSVLYRNANRVLCCTTSWSSQLSRTRHSFGTAELTACCDALCPARGPPCSSKMYRLSRQLLPLFLDFQSAFCFLVFPCPLTPLDAAFNEVTLIYDSGFCAVHLLSVRFACCCPCSAFLIPIRSVMPETQHQ